MQLQLAQIRNGLLDPTARSTDPETSFAAAQSVQGLTQKQTAVLQTLQRVGPCTDFELVKAYHADLEQPLQTDSGIRSRRNELVTKGKAFDTGRTEKLPTGRRGIVWSA